MTVSELIEKLQALHGDHDLRSVSLRIVVNRPYTQDVKPVEGWLSDVRLDMGEAVLKGFIWLE